MKKTHRKIHVTRHLSISLHNRITASYKNKQKISSIVWSSNIIPHIGECVMRICMSSIWLCVAAVNMLINEKKKKKEKRREYNTFVCTHKTTLTESNVAAANNNNNNRRWLNRQYIRICRYACIGCVYIFFTFIYTYAVYGIESY